MSDSRRGLTSKDDCLQAGSVAESEDARGTSDEDPDGLEEHWKTLCHLQTRLSYQHEDDDVLQGRRQSRSGAAWSRSSQRVSQRWWGRPTGNWSESSAYRPRVPAAQRLLDFCVSSMFFRVFLGVNPPFPGTATGQLHDFFGPRFLYEDISP